MQSTANDNLLTISGHKTNNFQSPLGGKIKRIFDIFLASICLALALPIMMAVIVTLKISGGPVFFGHERIGHGGKKFKCLKFRTMVRDPDDALSKFLEKNPEAAAEWQRNQKLKHDPRITSLGRILRKSSIDELPQFFNVLRGDMSCIGPRPVTADELLKFRDCTGHYLSCRPGITGLWQVSGRSSLVYSQRIALDVRYVENWSLWEDAVILVRTIFAVTRFNETS